MRKKILVCGSAGFLMSNFTRYILYRTKEYELISVDNLLDPNDYKRTYINKNNKFYIGDCTDSYFMDRLISIEKPDYIINGIGCYSFNYTNKFLHSKNIINSFLLLSKYNIPTIQLGFNKYCMYNTNLYKSKFTLLVLPNCFGFRQKTTIGVGNLIYNMSKNNTLDYSHLNDNLLWCFSEDVCSLIWFLIENDTDNVVYMPPVGSMSVSTISNIIMYEFGIFDQNENLNILPTTLQPDFITEPDMYYKESSSIKGWSSDSSSIENNLISTIRWYKANKWAIL